MALRLVACLLLAGSAAAATAPTASGGTPVAHAVLFYSPACGHCRDLIANYLPSILDQYGSRLQILSIDAAGPGGRKLFQAAVTRFDVPARDRGVPAVVIGDRFLSGTVDVSEELPILVAQHLASGGVGWPDVPGLSQAMAGSGGLVTSSPSRLLAATAQPDGVLDRLARDRLGNTLALIVLAGMLFAVARVVWRSAGIWRTVGRAPRPRTSRGLWVATALVALGLCVAGYLAYVESTGSIALCGPVGNCNAVQISPYARLFGVLPIAYVGLVGYVLIGAALAAGRFASGTVARTAARALVALTLCGTLFSIYLTTLEPFVIGATCAWCLSSAVIVTLLLCLSANDLRFEPRGRAPVTGADAAGSTT
jgi:uncharacterized membrane protein